MSTQSTSESVVNESLVVLLNQHLANMIDLKLQTKQAHWNVKGENFIALHQLFDDVAEAVDDYADMLAERAVQLGGIAYGTLQTIATASSLPAYSVAIQKSELHVAALTVVLKKVVAEVQKSIDTADEAGDKVTADLLTEVARGLDKWRWFVEAHVVR